MNSNFSSAPREKIEKRRLTLIVFILCVALNIVNCFGIQLFYHYEVLGNIDYASVVSVFEILIRLLNVTVAFSGFAVVCRSVLLLGAAGSLKYFLFVSASMLIPHIAGFVNTRLTTFGDSINYGALLLYSVISYLISLLIHALVLIVAAAVRRAALKKGIDPCEAPFGIFGLRNPSVGICFLISAVYTVTLTVQDALYTIELISVYGAPMNFGEILILATPYFENILFFFVQYCVMVFLINFFSRPLNRCKEIK